MRWLWSFLPNENVSFNRKRFSCCSHTNFYSNQRNEYINIPRKINSLHWKMRKPSVMFRRSEGWKLLDMRVYFVENFNNWWKDSVHTWSFSWKILLCCRIVWLAVTLLLGTKWQNFNCKCFKVVELVVWENSVG